MSDVFTAARNLASGLLVCTCLMISAADAQESGKVINVGTGNYAPLEFKDPQTGELTGFNHDLFNAMAKKAGFKVNWIEASYLEQASFAPLKTGRVDIQSGVMGDTPERREIGVNFIDFMYDPAYFYTLSGKANQFVDAAVLCGKRVANVRGSKMMTTAVDHWSEENCTKAGRPAVIQVDVASTGEEKLMLKQGRVDAAFTAVSALVQGAQAGDDAYKALGTPLSKFTYGFPFLEKNREVAETLKKALDELIADGTYAQLMNKWGLPDDCSIGKVASINAGK
ncbi:transporter substrate-binding domain-containing protein [Bradyrhizobium sp. B097]|uniref:transporter substrate-binding domain-containing protein n=1 Tax=Bradyrhizobium sp. B097 TaxID=3140244 RepID=UPI003182CF30